jgi:hypothetical protein
MGSSLSMGFPKASGHTAGASKTKINRREGSLPCQGGEGLERSYHREKLGNRETLSVRNTKPRKAEQFS